MHSYIFTIITVFMLLPITHGQQILPVDTGPVSTDAWDVKQGITVTAHSALNTNPEPYDARDIFGGEFGTYKGSPYGLTIFTDNAPAHFAHFVEWKTKTPVTIKSLRLFASPGLHTDPCGREFDFFIVKAKPLHTTTFSQILFAFYPTHPYELRAHDALLQANILPIEAQEFRAEFYNYAKQGCPGPRIVELDGFTEYMASFENDIKIETKVQISLPADTNYFQVQWAAKINPDAWSDFGPPIVGLSSKVFDSIQNYSQRFYRVLRVAGPYPWVPAP